MKKGGHEFERKQEEVYGRGVGGRNEKRKFCNYNFKNNFIYKQELLKTKKKIQVSHYSLETCLFTIFLPILFPAATSMPGMAVLAYLLND